MRQRQGPAAAGGPATAQDAAVLADRDRRTRRGSACRDAVGDSRLHVCTVAGERRRAQRRKARDRTPEGPRSKPGRDRTSSLLTVPPLLLPGTGAVDQNDSQDQGRKGGTCAVRRLPAPRPGARRHARGTVGDLPLHAARVRAQGVRSVRRPGGRAGGRATGRPACGRSVVAAAVARPMFLQSPPPSMRRARTRTDRHCWG